MSGAVTAVVATAAVVGTAVAYKNGQDQKQAAEHAAQQARSNAKKQALAADEASNRANQKRANAGEAIDAAIQAGKAGMSGTMLTGPQGIDPNLLNLGKNTLLGS